MGIFVQDINYVEDILVKLGFTCYYKEDEVINYQVNNVRKYSDYYDNALELIENKSRARGNSFHICFNGEVPEFMKQYRIDKYIPNDDNLLVDFVYIDDSIYFEFVRNKVSKVD